MPHGLGVRKLERDGEGRRGERWARRVGTVGGRGRAQTELCGQSWPGLSALPGPGVPRGGRGRGAARGSRPRTSLRSVAEQPVAMLTVLL